MISDEAVEAAAKARYDRYDDPKVGVAWGLLHDSDKTRHLEEARLMLEAAAPYLNRGTGEVL